MYVYVITNLINGKKYIGLSLNKKPYYRATYFGSGKLIKQAIAKYGKHNFTKEIIKEFAVEHEARLFEKELIASSNAILDSMYYNMAPGGYGGGNIGRKLSQKTKDKISVTSSIKNVIYGYGKNYNYLFIPISLPACF